MREVRQTGSAQLLQDWLEKQLVAVMCHVRDADGTEWISLAFGTTPGVFELERQGARWCLTVVRRVALPLISLTEILVREIGLLAKPGRMAQTSDLDLQVEGGVREGPLRCSWSADAAAASCEENDGQYIVMFRVDGASELVSAMVERFARAHLANRLAGD